MSIPTAAFLDTGVLDGQNYNFQSTALTTFVPACLARSVNLLLPDPTEREITRHIRERSQQAFNALEDARRKAPFLAKWRGLPQNIKSFDVEKWEVYRLAHAEWSTFLRQFTVVRLGYEHLDVKKVMKWYDDLKAPFREGKKRKEFPDAFALAMLDAYAQRESVHVAVVSGDSDLKLACERFNTLLYFESLPRLTELLLSDDSRLENAREVVDTHIDVLYEAVYEELGEFSLYHEDEHFRIGDTEFKEVDTVEPSIVAIGDQECTITFSSSVSARALLEWIDYLEEGPESQSDWVSERITVTGNAKLSFGKGDSLSVQLISFDEYEAGISEIP